MGQEHKREGVVRRTRGRGQGHKREWSGGQEGGVRGSDEEQWAQSMIMTTNLSKYSSSIRAG